MKNGTLIFFSSVDDLQTKVGKRNTEDLFTFTCLKLHFIIEDIFVF